METLITRIIAPILLWFYLSLANTQGFEIKEIRLHGVGGYSQNRFVVAICSDGRVQYTGVSFVAVEGKQAAQISTDDFRKLVRKINQIHFFKLENSYTSYPLDKTTTNSATGEVTLEHTFVTDQRTEVVTVITDKGTKSVEDYMGAPKGLFELEQMILDLTHARQWTGDWYDRDVPYYDKFPVSTQVTYRVLLTSYRRSIDSNRIAGYFMSFINNKGINFDVELQRPIELQKFDGYVVDATGQIKKTQQVEPKFVLAEIRRVRRYAQVLSR